MTSLDPSGRLGALALTAVRPRNSAFVLRAVRWQEGLARLGILLPLGVVHDVGLVLSTGGETHDFEKPRAAASSSAREERSLGSYESLIRELATCGAARVPSARASDELVVALLARVLSSVAERVRPGPIYAVDAPLRATTLDAAMADPLTAWGMVNRTWDRAAIDAIVDARLQILTEADTLDADTLSILGSAGTILDVVDALAALSSAEANDIANFSLELLPTVLEVKTRGTAVGTVADGYAGLANKGSLEALLPTELAWDDDEFARRVAHDEAIYYAREASAEETPRAHLVLVDASASMRGDRATFARGLALAVAKKLTLAHEPVSIRFFDSRLYEPIHISRGHLPVGALLGFKGERGRNAARVFLDLARVLEREPREVAVHLFTHAGLHVPRDVLSEVTRRGPVFGVFMLPSGGELDLDYVDLLASRFVVTHDTLASRPGRKDRARNILDAVELSPESRRKRPS